MKKLLLLLVAVAIVSISNAQTPKAAWSLLEPMICAGGYVQFLNNSTNATSYKWYFPDGVPSTSSEVNPRVRYMTSGPKYLGLVAMNGSLRDSAPEFSTSQGMPWVSDAPKITIHINHDTLFAEKAFGIPLSYKWFFNGNMIPGADTATLKVQKVGNYYVRGYYQSYSGCIVYKGVFYTGNNIIGKCFIDYNKNNIQDSGEPGYKNLSIKTTGKNDNWVTQPSEDGSYKNYADTGLVSTVPQSVLYYTCSPNQHSHTYTGYGQTDTVNFALVPTPGIRDIRISIAATTRHRSGRPLIYRITYSNAGTDTIANGRVYIVKDSRLPLTSTNPAYDIIIGDTIQWNYSNFLPNESRTIDINMSVPVPPALNIGDKLFSKAVLEPLTPNENVTTNYAYLNDAMVGAFDPNDITCLTGDVVTTQQITDGQYLNYLIRFQNTGNDTAFKVIVYDTLETTLDVNTIDFISSSHPCSMNIENNKNAVFLFNNIMLPDSNVNEALSHGYILYRVKPKNTLTAGTIINNRASIIFDYNLPVLTNTAVTYVTSPTGMGDLSHSNDVWLYPNPVTNKLMISLPDKHASIYIRNLMGQMVSQYETGKAQAEIDVSAFSKGIYFVEVAGEKNRWVGRFIKE